MKQLAIVVEGQTEEQFVGDVLRPHLGPLGIYIQPIIVKTSRTAGRASAKGGGSWKHWRKDIGNTLKSSQFVCVTTMIDFYGYPDDGPARCRAPHTDECITNRERGMAADISHGDRFLPFVMLHEFEALVFAAAPVASELPAYVQKHCAGVLAQYDHNAELINDGPTTAPSKRLKSEWSGYSKVRDGVAIAASAGLPVVRRRCPRFDEWLTRLEGFGAQR